MVELKEQIKQKGFAMAYNYNQARLKSLEELKAIEKAAHI
jgi:hypothetical protein